VPVKDDNLIEILSDMGVVTDEQLSEARAGEAEAAERGEGVVDLLVSKKYLAPIDITRARAIQFGAEFIDLDDVRLDDEVITAVPRNIAKKYNVVPVFADANSITVALSDPSDLDKIDTLQHLLKKEQFDYRVAPEDQIESAINRYYGAGDDQVAEMLTHFTQGDIDLGNIGTGENSFSSEDEVDSDAPLIKLVNTIIIEAFKMRASDIHIEPMEKRLRIRYRIDGCLQEVQSPPKRLQNAIVSRLKIQSGMSIAEKRIPQDGRIQLTVTNKPLDFRVNCLPCSHGESIVMRILDKTGIRLGLSELGFLTDDQQTFERLIGLPDGILLVTGPTGSGKTTTLYSCLNYINRPDRKIITVEDPVEYQLAGINQVQVSETIGLTFATALRAMLRQAPNVVMLGEIRDLETASIAINASLTGHLVFSTLHTNDAPSAVTRLIDIGVKPFLVASSARSMMAQRLVRKICKKCMMSSVPSEEELKALGIDMTKLTGANFMKGAGCKDCNKSGHRGRFGIFEIFLIDDHARKLIYERVPASVLRARALEMGMRSLRDDGARKVVAGLTTADEVIKATTSDH